MVSQVHSPTTIPSFGTIVAFAEDKADLLGVL